MGGYYTPPPGGGSGGAAGSLETTGAPVVVSAASPPANGDVLTATSPTTADWQPSGAGGSLLKIATVTLTGAQLAAINGTPVTGIAAQGAGKAAVVSGLQSLSVQVTAGTTPYNTYGALVIVGYYGNISGPVSTQGVFTDDITLGNDSFFPDYFGSDGLSQAVKSSFSNKSIVFQADAAQSTGRITASNITAGNAGLAYAVNDPFTVNTGTSLATGVVDSVAAITGAVLTYHLIAQGTEYLAADGVATTTTSGLGVGLQLDITAIQSVSGGDGTLTLTIPYIVVTLQ